MSMLGSWAAVPLMATEARIDAVILMRILWLCVSGCLVVDGRDAET